MEEIMDTMSKEKMQFAVLIDADNISSKYAVTIFEELEKYGSTSYRRIYGNWSKGNGWSEGMLLEYSIMPVQQFSYTTGKNATDMAMVRNWARVTGWSGSKKYRPLTYRPT